MKTTRLPMRINLVVVLMLVVLGCGIAPAGAAAPSGAAATTAQGGITGNFAANGKSLYIQCLGTGVPTIVLETGEGAPGTVMRNLQLRLAERTMTCTYDRANTGSSSSAPKPRTAQDIVEDLHALLAAASVPGPYVLVGHSAGGMLVQLYARKYADQVVGVVAMNPVPPAHPWLDEVSKIFTPQEYTDEQAYYHGENGEPLDYLTSSEQVAAAPKPSSMPFEMLISTIAQCASPTDVCGKSYSTYERIIQDVTTTWPQGHFSEVAAGHDIFHDDVEAVVAVVERVLPPAAPTAPANPAPGMPATGAGAAADLSIWLPVAFLAALAVLLVGGVLRRRAARRA
jgi:pimeloyl-ACP methyl ester carboxylesterase